MNEEDLKKFKESVEQLKNASENVLKYIETIGKSDDKKDEIIPSYSEEVEAKDNSGIELPPIPEFNLNPSDMAVPIEPNLDSTELPQLQNEEPEPTMSVEAALNNIGLGESMSGNTSEGVEPIGNKVSDVIPGSQEYGLEVGAGGELRMGGSNPLPSNEKGPEDYIPKNDLGSLPTLEGNINTEVPLEPQVPEIPEQPDLMHNVPVKEFKTPEVQPEYFKNNWSEAVAENVKSLEEPAIEQPTLPSMDGMDQLNLTEPPLQTPVSFTDSTPVLGGSNPLNENVPMPNEYNNDPYNYNLGDDTYPSMTK